MTGDRRVRRREYERIHKEAIRRRKGVPIRKDSTRLAPGTNTKRYLDAKRAYQFLARFLVWEETSNQGRWRLNGVIMEPDDYRYLNHLKNGTMKSISLDVADRLSVTYHFPLWELEEAALAQS